MHFLLIQLPPKGSTFLSNGFTDFLHQLIYRVNLLPMPVKHDIKVLPNLYAMAQESARRVCEGASALIAATGQFSIALSGGSTPRALYQLLAADPYREAIDWSKVQIFFGDERCVSPDHPDSNYRMATEAMLSLLPIPAGQVHRISGEIEPQLAAQQYDEHLLEHFGEGGLDMVLLGMGDDGHTASLFPHSAALSDTTHRCVANHIDKLKTWRITMTAPFINRCGNVLVLASGSGKARRIHEVLEGEEDPQQLPIQLIQPASGKLAWLLDADAAGML